jgi:hypothetical protein
MRPLAVDLVLLRQAAPDLPLVVRELTSDRVVLQLVESPSSGRAVPRASARTS